MYVPITLDEMRAFLKESKGWVENSNGFAETIFDYEKDGFIIRVFSSISENEGICKESGKDAIRVAILFETQDGSIRGIKKFSHITRQENWQIHLKRRVMKAFNYIPMIRICPDCSNLLSLRKNKSNNSEFFGCSQYPDCRYTESV